MPAFDHSYSASKESTQINISSTFKMDNLGELMNFCREKIKEGTSRFDIDLRVLDFINSEMLGSLVLLNTLTRNQRGSLRLIIARDSKVLDLFRQTRLDRILNIRTT